VVLDMLYDPPHRNPGKPWVWIIIDSLIIAGIAFVSSLPENRLPSLLDVYVSLRAFLYAFLFQLAVEKGLKPYYYRRKKRLKKGGSSKPGSMEDH